MLDAVPRLSRRARLEICERFETVDDLLRAEVIELEALRGIGRHLAMRVIEAARATGR